MASLCRNELTHLNTFSVSYEILAVIFFFVLLYSHFLWIHLMHLPMWFRVASVALKQSYDCPSASEVTLKHMGNIDRQQTVVRERFDTSPEGGGRDVSKLVLRAFRATDRLIFLSFHKRREDQPWRLVSNSSLRYIYARCEQFAF